MAENLDIKVNLQDSATKGLKNLNAQFIAIAATVTAFVATVSKVTKAAAEFETGMANVATLMEGDAQDAIAMYGDTLKDMAMTTGTSLADLTEGLFFVVSAGVEAEKQQQFLTETNKLAIAGNTDLSTSIKAVVGFTKAYGEESVDAQKAADLLFKINKKGFTTFEEVATSINKVVTFSNLASVSQEELAAAMATLVGATGNAAEVSTQLNGIFKSMVKPSADMTAAIQAADYETGALMIESLGLQGALNELFKQTGSNEDAFSKLFTEAEALKAVMPLVGAQADTFTDNLYEMENGSEAVTDAFEDQQETFDAQVKILKESVNVVMVELGEEILPMLTDAVKFLSEWIQDNQDTIREWASAIETTLDVALKGAKIVIDGVSLGLEKFDGWLLQVMIQAENAKRTLGPIFQKIGDTVLPILGSINNALTTFVSLMGQAEGQPNIPAGIGNTSGLGSGVLGNGVLGRGASDIIGFDDPSYGGSSGTRGNNGSGGTRGSLGETKNTDKSLIGFLGGASNLLVGATDFMQVASTTIKGMSDTVSDFVLPESAPTYSIIINIDNTHVWETDDVMQYIGDPIIKELKNHFAIV